MGLISLKASIHLWVLCFLHVRVFVYMGLVLGVYLSSSSRSSTFC